MQFGSNTLSQWASFLSVSPSRKSPPPPRPPPPLTWADRVARGLTSVRNPHQVPNPTSPPSFPPTLPFFPDNPLSPPIGLLPPSENLPPSPRIPPPSFLHPVTIPHHMPPVMSPSAAVKSPTSNLSTLQQISQHSKKPVSSQGALPITPAPSTTSPPSISLTLPNAQQTKPISPIPPIPQVPRTQPSRPSSRPQSSKQQVSRSNSSSGPPSAPISNGYAQVARPLSPESQGTRQNGSHTLASRTPLSHPQTQPANAQALQAHSATPQKSQMAQPLQSQNVKFGVALKAVVVEVEENKQQAIKDSLSRRNSSPADAVTKPTALSRQTSSPVVTVTKPNAVSRQASSPFVVVTKPRSPVSKPPIRPVSAPTPCSYPSSKLQVVPTKRRRRPPRASVGDLTMDLPPRALRGLVNCGNSCFTNAVLQALAACEPFRRLMLRCDEADIGEQDGLVQKFVRLVKEMTVMSKQANGDTETNGGIKGGSKGERVDANGWSHATNGNRNGQHGGRGGYVKNAMNDVGRRRDNGFVVEDPLMPDWFFDVFPGSGPTGSGGYRGGSQEDAEEFLSYVLNGLHEELVELEKEADNFSDGDGTNNSSGAMENGAVEDRRGSGNGNGVWNGWHEAGENGVWEEMTRKGKTVEVRGGSFAESGITDIFGGVLRNELKRGRSKPSVTKEPFFTLSLDIESGMIRDVEHALSAYFEPEQLEGYAESGGEEVEARKQVGVEQAPQVLVLHLKRFSHNTVTGALTKVSRMMPFPEILELPSQAGYGAIGKFYVLTAVVTHIGKDLAAGHYTSDVRWEGENWVSCDDSKVSRSSLSKAVRKQAYLLFYSLQCGKESGRTNSREH